MSMAPDNLGLFFCLNSLTQVFLIGRQACGGSVQDSHTETQANRWSNMRFLRPY